MAATKLLLVDDVDELGRCGDIVSVKPGYARNKLLPSGLAILADKKSLRMQVRLQEERRKKAIADKQESENLKSSVEGIILTTIVKVDHEGHMYGSVSALDIVHLLQEQASVTIEKKAVQLKHSIKTIGVYDIMLKLKEDVATSIKLKVISEEAKEEAPPGEIV
jgi:large subunit ribosomal protein L9